MKAQKLKQLLADKVPKNKAGLLPSGFQRIGDIIILNLKPGLKPYEKDIGKTILKSYPNTKTVCAKFDSIKGELRVPNIKPIAGKETNTIHSENGCKFKLDVTKIMFAKGNVRERARLPPQIKPNEVIVDMFAGIGYFSIPIAVHASPSRIIVFEKNPNAVGFLKDNIKLNKINTNLFEIIQADNRTVNLKNVADRILMDTYQEQSVFLILPLSF